MNTEQHKDRIEASLVELIIENKADIVVLAEYEADLLNPNIISSYGFELKSPIITTFFSKS